MGCTSSKADTTLPPAQPQPEAGATVAAPPASDVTATSSTSQPVAETKTESAATGATSAQVAFHSVHEGPIIGSKISLPIPHVSLISVSVSLSRTHSLSLPSSVHSLLPLSGIF